MFDQDSLRNLLNEIWDCRTEMPAAERRVFYAGWQHLRATITPQHRVSALAEALLALVAQAPTLLEAGYREYIPKELEREQLRADRPKGDTRQQYPDSLVGRDAYDELQQLWEVPPPAPVPDEPETTTPDA